MSNLKVFQLAANGRVQEVDLAAVKGVRACDIHPHSPSAGLPDDSDDLAHIMSMAAARGHKNLGVIQVGIGDPTSVPSGQVIPQERHVARLNQPALEKVPTLVA